MTITATVSKKHLLRLGFLSFFCVGLAGWSLYDGLVAYPAQQERQREPYAAFQKISKKYEESGEVGRWEEWTALAEEKGWSKSEPEKPREQYEINLQFIMAALAGPVGLLFLTNLIRTLGREMEADETGITASWGPRVDFDKITKIDKKKWDKKGITKLTYQSDQGEKKFTVDDFIFERPPTDEIMRLIEQQAGLDKIVNGKPEPEPKPKEEPEAAEPEPAQT